MRIVQVLLGLNTGGMELLALQLAIACRQMDLDSHILALDGEEVSDQRFLEAGVPLTLLTGRRLADRGFHRRVHAALAALRPTVLHTHHFTPLLHTVLPAAQLGIARHVHTEHGANYLEERRDLRFVLRTLSLRCDAFVLVGERMRPFYRDRVGIAASRLRVVENGVDTTRFAPRALGRCDRALLGLPDGPLVVTSARLHPQKDLPTLLAAASRAIKCHPSAQFVIIGDGDERPRLEQEIRERGLMGNVHMLGWRHDISEILAAADVFALSSVWEGLPLSVLEAMSSGLPVVSTRVGDLDRVVREGQTGFLVGVSDAAALADRIVELLAAPARAAAFGAAARATVVEQFGFESMVRSYLDLYRAP